MGPEIFLTKQIFIPKNGQSDKTLGLTVWCICSINSSDSENKLIISHQFQGRVIKQNAKPSLALNCILSSSPDPKTQYFSKKIDQLLPQGRHLVDNPDIWGHHTPSMSPACLNQAKSTSPEIRVCRMKNISAQSATK